MEPIGVTIPQDGIAVILDEAACLTPARILALGAAYPREQDERMARTHLIDVAVRRDGRRAETRELKAAAAAAVQRAASAADHRGSLRRFGVLTDAERAVQDAVLAIFLSDRLGPEQVARLSGPWLAAR